MLAATPAAGLHFVELNNKLSASIPSSSKQTNFHYPTPVQAFPTSHPQSLTKRPSTNSQQPSTATAIPVQRRATSNSTPSPFLRLVFPIWDRAWRAWYVFIVTWGISAMEPWELVFTLLLFAALLLLFGIALVKLPAYTQYAVKRSGYYIFGHTTRSLFSTLPHGGVNQTLESTAAAVRSNSRGFLPQLESCQQALVGARENASSLTEGALKGAGGVVKRWSQAS